MLWDVHKRRCLRKGDRTVIFKTHQSYGVPLALSPDGRMLIIGNPDGTIDIIDLRNGKKAALLLGHQARIVSVSLTENCYYALSADDQGIIRYWDIRKRLCLKEFKVPEGNLAKAVLCKNGQTAFLANAHDYQGKGPKVRVLDIVYGKFLYEFIEETRKNFISDLGVSSDGKIALTAHMDGQIRTWNTRKSIKKQSLKIGSHVNSVRAVAVSPNSNLILSAGSDKVLYLWKPSSTKWLMKFEGHTMDIGYAGFSSKGKKVISSATDAAIKLWDIKSGKCERTINESDRMNSPNDLVILPEGRFVISLRTNNKKILDLVTGENLKLNDRYPLFHWLNQRFIWGLALSPGNTYAALRAHTNVLRLFDRDGIFLTELKGHEDLITDICFSHSGKYLVSASMDCKIIVWDMKARTCHRTFIGHGREVNGVAIFPDDRLIISGGSDGMIRIWDVEQNACISVYDAKNQVTCIDISNDGEFLCAGLHNGNAIILKLHNLQKNAPRYVNAVYRWNWREGKLLKNFSSGYWDKTPTIICSWCNRILDLFLEEKKNVKRKKLPFRLIKARAFITDDKRGKTFPCPLCKKPVHLNSIVVDTRNLLYCR